MKRRCRVCHSPDIDVTWWISWFDSDPPTSGRHKCNFCGYVEEFETL